MHLIELTPAASEPLTLAEAKLHVRQDSTADDALISGLIQAAREHAETMTGRCIAARNFQISMDRFPFYDGTSPRRGAELGVGAWEQLELRRIRLPRPPLIAVIAINYTDTNGVAQVCDPSTYLVSNLREPGTIEPVYGQVWPIARYQADSVQVPFTAGYVTSTIAGTIAPGVQTLTPGSMNGIAIGTILTVDQGAAQENVLVTGVSSTTFTATFAQNHAAGAKITSVPGRIQAGLKLMVGHWYTNREEVADKQPFTVPHAAQMLLAGCDFVHTPDAVAYASRVCGSCAHARRVCH